MKMHRYWGAAIAALLLLAACKLPAPDKKEPTVRVKQNIIILLDLSDRLIIQDEQPERDKEIIKGLYEIFEDGVKRDLYVKSRDEIKVVLAPQLGADLNRDEFEDRLYVNMDHVDKVYRRAKEGERKELFLANLDTLYQKAVFSRDPEEYNGADIWKYCYEDLEIDYSWDPDARNYLIILTDGYPIVGKNRRKLYGLKSDFPGLEVILMEAAPREKDMEWDNVMKVWENWFHKIGVEEYTMIKRGSITKEMEQVRMILEERKPTQLAKRLR